MATFTALLEYLEREEDVLRALLAKDLKSCLRTGGGTRGHVPNAERLKYYKVYCKLEPNLDSGQKEQIEFWEAKLCNMEKDPEFVRLLDIIHKRKDELQALGKSSLEACFQTNKSNEDKDLKFVRNFFNRKKNCLTAEQEAQLENLQMEICAGDVALRPVTDELFARVVDIIHKQKDELQALGKSSLEACFQTNKSNEDKDLKFVRNFFNRKKIVLLQNKKHNLRICRWRYVPVTWRCGPSPMNFLLVSWTSFTNKKMSCKPWVNPVWRLVSKSIRAMRTKT